MDNDEIFEHRFRFFSDKGLNAALESDKTFVTLFTAIIAGILALVVNHKVSFWSGTFFLIADVLAIVGLAWCLLHMAFTAKLMLAYAAHFGGDDHVPNVVEQLEEVADVIPRLKANSQRAYLSELCYLFLSVSVAGLGLAIELWSYIQAAGLVIGVLVTFLIVVAVSIRVVVQGRTSQQS